MRVIFEMNGERYEADLPEQTLEALQEIADRKQLSLIAALQQAIVNEKFLEDQQAEGWKLLIEKGDSVRELVPS